MNTHPTVELLETRLMLSGTTYVVNSLADTVANDGQLTLREAIQAANTDAAVNEAPAGSSTDADTITFDPALFASGPATITLSGTELAITSSLTIQGPGAATLTIDAAGLSRVFNIAGSGPGIRIEGLTITGGNAQQGNGGGILIKHTTASISNCVIGENNALFGGGIYIDGDYFDVDYSTPVSVTCCNITANTAFGGGGGIWSEGTVTAINTTVSRNWTAQQGGGVCVVSEGLRIVNCTITANSAADGGGIDAGGSASFYLNNSIVAANYAPNAPDVLGGVTGHGNLISIPPGFVRSPSAGVDGKWRTADDDPGDLHLRADGFTVNWGRNELAEDSGGNLLTTDADGATRVSGGIVDAGAYEYQGVIADGRETPSTEVTSLSDVSDAYDGKVTLREAMAYSDQEGLGNTVTFLPSLFANGPGTVTLSGVEFVVTSELSIIGPGPDSLTIDAAGKSRVFSICGPDSDASLWGMTITGGVNAGGMLVSNGKATLLNCKISGNTSTTGGGIYIANSTVNLANVVISGNSVTAFYQGQLTGAVPVGGGIYIYQSSVTLTNCTVAGNWALVNYGQSDAGGIYTESGEVTLNNTIVADNSAKTHANISGAWSGRGNYVGDSPDFVRKPSAGPDGKWGTADDDGGDLRLRQSSRCINKGINSLAVDSNGNPLTVDMDGNARVFGSRVDIGAYELNAWQFVLVGDGTMHFIDADGTPVTISYKGVGSVTIDRTPSGNGPDGQSWGNIQTITIDGSDAQSSLIISTKGWGQASWTNVGQVVVNGPIKAISAKHADLTGSMTVDGSLSSLRLHDVFGEAISIGTPALGDTTTKATITLHKVHDAGLTSDTPIKSLTAVDWLNTDGQADVISAPWIGGIRLTGAGHGRRRIAGDFGADLTLTDTDTKGRSLRSFKATGAVTGTWALAGGAKSITMGSSDADWLADFGTDGAWADVDSIRTTAGDLCGQITARSIDRIRTNGRQANITITLKTNK